MYGFKEIGDMCLALEQAAKNSDINHAHQLASQITKYLDEVPISYVVLE